MSILDIFRAPKPSEQKSDYLIRGSGMGGGKNKLNYWKASDEAIVKPADGELVLDATLDPLATADNPTNAIFSAGRKSAAVMRTMGYEPVIMSCKNLIQSGVKQLQYSLNYNTEAKPATIELFEKQLQQIDVYELIGSVLQGYFYGYNITQLIWKDRLIAGIRDRGFADFSFLNNGSLVYSDTDEVLLDTNFYASVYQQSSYNLYGEAILASVFDSWQKKMLLQYYWSEYCRKYGTPIALGKIKNIPHDKRTDEKYINGKITDTLAQLELFNENSYAAVIDDMVEIDFLAASTQGNKTVYENMIEYLDKQIVRALLGSDSVSIATAGRLGNNAEATHNFQIILENIRAFVQTQLNKILQFVAINNGIDKTQTPTFILSDGQYLDYDLKRAQLDVLRSQLGVTFSEEYFIDYYSDLDNDNFTLGKANTTTTIETPVEEETDLQNKKSKIVNFASSVINQANQNSVIKKARENESVLNEFLVDANIETGMNESFETMRNEVMELLSLYDKPSDVRKDIANIFNTVNDKAIVEAMEKILLTTDIYGKDSVQSEGE